MENPELIAAVNRAIDAYEEITGQYASRTRNMLDLHGYIDTLERIVQSPDLQSGFRALRDRNQLDLTFEAVVVRFSSNFTASANQAAQWRLDNADDLL